MLREKRPVLDRNLGLVLTFFCAGTPSTKGTLDLMKSLNVNPEKVTSVRYRGDGWPGRFTVISANGGGENSLSYRNRGVGSLTTGLSVVNCARTAWDESRTSRAAMLGSGLVTVKIWADPLRGSHTKRARDSAPSHGREIRRTRTRGRNGDPSGSAQPNQSNSRALRKAARHAAVPDPSPQVRRFFAASKLGPAAISKRASYRPWYHAADCFPRSMASSARGGDHELLTAPTPRPRDCPGPIRNKVESQPLPQSETSSSSHSRDQKPSMSFNTASAELWRSACPSVGPGHRTMRICMLAYSFYENDSRMLQYATALVQRGDAVDVIALRREGQPDHEVLNGVNVFRIQSRTVNEYKARDHLVRILMFLLRAAVVLTRKHWRLPYQLIHVHSVPDFLVFAALVPRLPGPR